MAKKKLTIEEQIEQVRIKRDAERDKEIAQLKLQGEIPQSIIDTAKAIEKLKSDFKEKYGVEFVMPVAKTELTIDQKVEIVKGLTVEDKPKYVISEDKIIGTKGEEIKSVIPFYDKEGNKQTISVKTILNHLSKNK